MATITGFTADRMLEIENSTVVSGTVANGELKLTKRDGSVVNAGHVQGPPGLKGDKGDNGQNPALSLGALEPTYTGAGSARVKRDGLALTQPLEWLTPYKPNGSRRVRVQTYADAEYIVGQVSENRRDLVLAPKWSIYPLASNDNSFNTRATATKLSSGLVVLSGLLRQTGVVNDGELIAVLPADMRPSINHIIGVILGDAARSIQIMTNGNIHARGGWAVADNYMSLDGVAFFAANTVTWTPVVGSPYASLGAAFIPHSDPQWGQPSYYKDPYGFVWFQGLLHMQHNVSADNWPMVVCTGPLASYKNQHYYTAASDGFGTIGSYAGQGLVWKSGSPTAAGTWFTLSNVVMMTSDAEVSNSWVNPSPRNNWVNFSTDFPSIGVLRRPDGLCIAKGLVKGGSIGTRVVAAPPEFWPENGRLVIPTNSMGYLGKVDIGSAHEFDATIQPGGLVTRLGNTTWFSFDCVKWVV